MVWLMHFAAVVGFLVFGGITSWVWRESKAQENYIAVAAKILDSGVEESRSTGSSRGARGRTGTSTKQYAAKVRYAYEIAGARYESDVIGVFSGRSSDPSKARKKVAQYPKGSSATAYVNAQHPEDAVLEKGISPWITAAFAAGAVLWLAIWECVAWAVRRKPKAATTAKAEP